jgi:hypothetical protein
MFLCGLDNDYQPAAVNIANCQAIYCVFSDEEEMLMVEWSGNESSLAVYSKDAVICTPQRVAAVLMSLKERNP